MNGAVLETFTIDLLLYSSSISLMMRDLSINRAADRLKGSMGEGVEVRGVILSKRMLQKLFKLLIFLSP